MSKLTILGAGQNRVKFSIGQYKYSVKLNPVSDLKSAAGEPIPCRDFNNWLNQSTRGFCNLATFKVLAETYEAGYKSAFHLDDLQSVATKTYELVKRLFFVDGYLIHFTKTNPYCLMSPDGLRRAMAKPVSPDAKKAMAHICDVQGYGSRSDRPFIGGDVATYDNLIRMLISQTVKDEYAG